MDRARKSRSYGRKSYGVKMWGTFVGQLLIRTVNRAQRIHSAMVSRGFTGELRSMVKMKWQMRDTVFVGVATVLMVLCRWVNVCGLGFMV